MKILYFTRDFGAENIEFARKNGLTMRNAAAQETGANVEPCDYVYGDDIPENYRTVYPLYTLPESGMELATLQAENAQLKAALDQAQAEIQALKDEISKKPAGKKRRIIQAA